MKYLWYIPLKVKSSMKRALIGPKEILCEQLTFSCLFFIGQEKNHTGPIIFFQNLNRPKEWPNLRFFLSCPGLRKRKVPHI